jgi:hypothetical protein
VPVRLGPSADAILDGDHKGGFAVDRIGAAVWATGHAGRVIVEAGLTRPWLEFRGGIVYSAAKEGMDLGSPNGYYVYSGGKVALHTAWVTQHSPAAQPDAGVNVGCRLRKKPRR